MIRSIDSQYRIRQIDPDVATMSVIPDEKEGVKRYNYYKKKKKTIKNKSIILLIYS